MKIVKKRKLIYLKKVRKKREAVENHNIVKIQRLKIKKIGA